MKCTKWNNKGLNISKYDEMKTLKEDLSTFAKEEKRKEKEHAFRQWSQDHT